MKQMRLSNISTWPVAKGKAELLRHLKGEDLTLKQMVLAKCYDCMVGFTDGKLDCKVADCPIYPMMSYREEGVRKRHGRTMTEEQRVAASERLRLARLGRSAQ